MSRNSKRLLGAFFKAIVTVITMVGVIELMIWLVTAHPMALVIVLSVIIMIVLTLMWY